MITAQRIRLGFTPDPVFGIGGDYGGVGDSGAGLVRDGPFECCRTYIGLGEDCRGPEQDKSHGEKERSESRHTWPDPLQEIVFDQL